MTHTYVELGVNSQAFDEIANRLKAAGYEGAAGYEHVFTREGPEEILTRIDMRGIALVRVPSRLRSFPSNELEITATLHIALDAIDALRARIDALETVAANRA
jgi:hypothetical protein